MPNRVVFDRITGKRIIIDENNNFVSLDLTEPIDISKTKEDKYPPRSQEIGGFAKTIEARPSDMDTILQKAMEFVPSILGGPAYQAGKYLYDEGPKSLPLLGGAVGSLGGPVGLASGTFAGSLAKQFIEGTTAEGKGLQYQPITGSMLGEAGLETAINSMFNPAANITSSVLPKLATSGGRSRLNATLMNSSLMKRFLKPGELDPEVRAYLEAHPEIPVSYGQATKSQVATKLEEMMNVSGKNKIVDEQVKQFSKKLEDLVPFKAGTEDLTNVVKANLEAGRLGSIKERTGLYDRFFDIGDKNIQKINVGVRDPITGKMISQSDEIKGPVSFNTAKPLAKQALEKIYETYGTRESAKLLPLLKEDMRPIFTKLQGIADISSGKTGVNPVNLKAAMDAKHIIGDLGDFGKIDPSHEQSIFRKLAFAIDKDIETSVKNFGYKGQEAASLYTEAKAKAKRHIELYHENPDTKGILETKLSGMPEFQSLMKDPVAIKKAIEASADPQITHLAFQSEFMNQILNKTIAANEKSISGETPFNIIKDLNNQSTYKTLFNSVERAGHNQLFKTLSAIDPTAAKQNIISVGFQLGRAGLYFASGVAGVAMANRELSPTAVVGGGILGLALSGRGFVRHILLDPKAVRIVTQLAKLPPESTSAKLLTKSLFLGMKGAQLEFLTPDGATVGTGTVNNKGKVVPNGLETQD